MISYYKHIPFSLSMTIQRANVGEIDDLIELAAKLGAEEVNLASAQLTKKLVSQNLALSPRERKHLQHRLFSLEESSPLPVNVLFDLYLENPFFFPLSNYSHVHAVFRLSGADEILLSITSIRP